LLLELEENSDLAIVREGFKVKFNQIQVIVDGLDASSEVSKLGCEMRSLGYAYSDGKVSRSLADAIFMCWCLVRIYWGNWFGGGGWIGAFKDELGCLEPDGMDGWDGGVAASCSLSPSPLPLISWIAALSQASDHPIKKKLREMLVLIVAPRISETISMH